jgi:tRNA1(Val) A37 N6-methylase TrmN6
VAELNSSLYDVSSFLGGRLRFYQKKGGFRFGTDSFLFADFIRLKGAERFADLGTGCGVISILLLARHGNARAVGIDILHENSRLAVENAKLNGVSEQFCAVTANVKDLPALFKGGSFDVVLTNPPFVEAGKGGVSKNLHRAVARQELTATLEDFVRAGSHLLKSGGRFFVLLPPYRFTDAVVHMRSYRLEPKRLRFVHPEAKRRATLFMVEAVKDGRKGVVVEPPLVVYSDASRRIYTEEVARKYEEFLG